MRKKQLRTPAVSADTADAPAGTANPAGTADSREAGTSEGTAAPATASEPGGPAGSADAASGDLGSGDADSADAGSVDGADSAAGEGSSDSPTPSGRRARVRNRLLVSVVVPTLTVLGAGTPGVLAAARDVSGSQHLVRLAHLGEKSVALSHDLADERDTMVGYVAGGRVGGHGAGLSESQRARVDRQSGDVAADDSTPAALRKRLYALPKIRQQALSGHGSAGDTYAAYTTILTELHRVSGAVSRDLPGRVREGTDDALPRLGTAVDQASAERGLLRAALAGTGPEHDLTRAAQLARQRERAALADFHETADGDADDVYEQTVTGTEVAVAERDLARLTDAPYLDPADRALDAGSVAGELSARIDRMRSVQASLAAQQADRLEKLRGHDVTELEWTAALVLGLLLLAAGVAVQTARSMARPLSVLTRGSQRLAADPAGEGAVAYHGRNDEFAEVVRSLNRLRDTAVALKAQAGAEGRSEPESDAADGGAADAEQPESRAAESKRTAESKAAHDALVAERDRLHSEYETLKEQLAVVSAHSGVEAEEAARHGAFVNHLALRTLGLVERQLGVIEGLENQETDPDRLGTFFTLDHLATRMRRHSENLLLLVGAENAGTRRTSPVPLVDVLRAAVSEIDRYERVELGELPPHVDIVGPAADDMSHLIAELLDNAAAFSPAHSHVGLAGWVLENGDVRLSVRDSGVGIPADRLDALNSRLRTPEPRPGTEPDAPAPAVPRPERGTGSADGTQPDAEPSEREESAGLGLYVVARLAARHGLRVELRTQERGGVAAVVTVPAALASPRPGPETAPYAVYRRTPAAPGAQEARPATDLGTEPAAEPGGEPDADGPYAEPETGHGPLAVSADTDPLIAAAERALHEARTDGPDAAPADGADAAGTDGTDPARTHGTPGRIPDVPQPRASAENLPPEESPLPGESLPAGEEHARAEETVEPGPHGSPAPPSAAGPFPEGGAGHDGAGGDEEPRTGGTTGKGLPKRVPRRVPARPARPGGAASQGERDATGERRRRGVDAEELRRQLGGFQRGAQDGRRAAEAEAVAEEDGTAQPDAGRDAGVNGRPDARSDGGTTEEART